MSTEEVVIDYTNWRGVRSYRTITPFEIYFGSTIEHPERQWLMKAFDIKKEEMRTFAMKDIHSWTPFADPLPEKKDL